MAPAAQLLHSTLITSIPTEPFAMSVTPGSMGDSGVSTRTTTITVTSTVTVDAPRTTPTQYYRDASTTYNSDITNTVNTLHIHGIVPGLQPSSPPDSPSPRHHARPQTFSTAVSKPSAPPYIASPTSSNYPRPSPPGFLYPEPIVPPTASDAQDTSTMQNGSAYHPTIFGRADYELAYLPPALKLLLLITLATITLASCWAVLVILVNFPPGKWGIWKYWAKERRPLDKPSKHTRSNTGGIKSARAAPNPSNQFARNAHNDPGIQLLHRPHHRNPAHQRTHSSLSRRNNNLTSTEHRRTSSSPAPALRFAISAPPSSPHNPFLHPPRQTFVAGAHVVEPRVARTSSDWIADRASFFSAPSPSPSYPPTPSPRSSPPSPLHHHRASASTSSTTSSSPLDASALAALEAGTAPLTGHTRARSAECRASEGGALTRSLSWLDQGLAMVDGAVTRVAGGIAGWSDDEGGEGGLLVRGAWGKGKVE